MAPNNQPNAPLTELRKITAHKTGVSRILGFSGLGFAGSVCRNVLGMVSI